MHPPLLARVVTLLSSTLLFSAALANSFNCKDVVADGHLFDFSQLSGPHTVSHVTELTPNVRNTTYTIDICSKLSRDRNLSEKEQCLDGTWVCGVSRLNPGNENMLEEVTSFVRQYDHDGAHINPTKQILPDSSSNSDSEKEGVRVVLGGGIELVENKKVPQKAVIEFLCPKPSKRRRSDSQRRDDNDDQDDKPNPEWEKAKSTDDGHEGTLTFISRTRDEKQGTLHLEWKTKFACMDYDGSDGDGPGSSSGGGWGFFSWLFFLGFVGLVGYFGFFAWINYNKYGATGWDLVPHADTIRDLPYVLNDWGHKVIGSMTGGSSRGGYSAV